MADFTQEQMEEIREEFLRTNPGGKYTDDFGMVLDGIAAFEAYLQAQRQHFQKKFADEKAEREKQEQSEHENAEKELEVYLQSVYVDERGSSEDITQETWQSRGYAEWRDNYAANHPNDGYYSELKERVVSLSKNTKSKQAEVKEVKAPEENAAKVFTLADIEHYLTLQEEYLNRENADKEFEQLHENAQTDLRDFIAGKLEIEPAAYDKMEDFIKVFADGYKADEMKKLAADAKAKLAELNKKAKQEKLSSIVEGLGRNAAARVEPAAIIPGVVPPTNTLNMRKDTDKQQNLKHDEQVTEERIRSANSDANEFMLDKVKLDVLLEMKVISQEIHDAGIKDPAAAIEKLNSRRPLNEQETIEFENRMADKMLNNEQLFGLLPPSVLAKQYNKLQVEIMQTANHDPNADLSALETQLSKVSNRIDKLIDEYDSGITSLAFEQYNFADNSNIADIYDGYVEMLSARQPDVDADRAAKMNRVKERLDADINLYDQAWNLDGLTEQDTRRLEDNQEHLAHQLSQINLDEQTQKWLDNISFTDEDNQPLPPEEQQKRRQTFVDFARNNTVISHLADKENVSQEQLQKDFQDHLMLQVFSLANVEDTLKGLAEEKDKFSDQKYFQNFAAQMTNLNRPLTISAEGYKRGVQSAVNSTMACINRIGKSVGKSNPLLRKLHAPIAKYDERRADRFDNDGGYKRMGWRECLKTFGWTTGATLASKACSYGIYKGAAMLGANLSLPASAGIAAIGLSTTGMLLNYRNYKKSQKAKNEKASFGDFLIRKPYRSQNIASTLGFVAGACLVSGRPELAMIAGVGALGVMGYSKWKEARKGGLNKKEAARETIKQLLAVATGAGIGSYLGSMFGMTPDTTQTSGEATPGYTTHDYTADEHNWAAMRNDDPRWSEFLNKYHVAADLQNPADTNTVSADAMANLKAAITQAIGDNKEFYSDMGNGNLQPNTEMLAYKATQLLYLAPNDGAITTGGAPIGDILGYTDANGEHISYIDALRQAISTGKVDNPQGFAEMLSKVENVIGGQNENGVNDMGKITLFGTHDPAAPVQSYNANADAGYNENPHEGTKPHTDTIPGHKIWALGYWEPVKEGVSKLKDRIGAFADKIRGKKKKIQDVPVDPVVPVVVEEEQKLLPEHKKPLEIAQYSELSISEMLDKEYKIVHGIEPGKLERIRYSTLVQKEMAADAMGTTELGAYLQKRMDKFEDTLKTNVAPNDEAKGFADTEAGKKHINETRQTMWKTNLSADGKPLESKDVTLLHFEKLAGIGKNNAEYAKVKAAEDRRRTPAAPGKAGRPHGGTYDVTAVSAAKNSAGR